jgi:hypothetical protein
MRASSKARWASALSGTSASCFLACLILRSSFWRSARASEFSSRQFELFPSPESPAARRARNQRTKELDSAVPLDHLFLDLGLARLFEFRLESDHPSFSRRSHIGRQILLRTVVRVSRGIIGGDAKGSNDCTLARRRFVCRICALSFETEPVRHRLHALRSVWLPGQQAPR